MTRVMWRELSAGWQAAFMQAWDAYKRGANPIGAAVTDARDQVLVVGQNRMHDISAPVGQICSTPLAHAEVNALIQLDSTTYSEPKEYILYATLEPCALCFSALRLSGLRHLKFACRDTVGGATGPLGSLPYFQKKNIRIEGPDPFLEAVQIVIRSDWAHRNTIPGVIDKETAMRPEVSELGKNWFEAGKLPAMVEEGASIEAVFDRISEGLARVSG